MTSGFCLRNERGMAMMLVILLSLIVMVFAVIFMVRVPQELKSTEAMAERNRAFLLADSGVQAAVARLRRKPLERSGVLVDSVRDAEFAISSGTFKVSFEDLGNSRVRVVSVGTVPLGRAVRAIEAVVRVDNPGDFFSVSTGDLTISRGSNLGEGKVYAGRSLRFDSAGSGTTKIKGISYFRDFDGVYGLYPPLDDWKNGSVDFVELNGSSPGPDNYPSKELNPATIPPMDERALNWYKSLAGDNTTINNFSGDIQPANGSHVYYYDGDITIQGTIHAQVTIVARGNVTFTGDFVKSDDASELDPTDPDYLGSPVHAGGIFTAKDVFIDPLDPNHNDMRLEALILAPNGKVEAKPNSDAASFTFKGSFLVGNGIFIKPPYPTRTYQFDPDHQSHPLPNMPWMAEVVYWNEVAVPAD